MKISSLHRRPNLVAFTLVELMVVLGIIALLLSVAFPAFSSMIQKGQSIACSQHLKSIGVAVMQAASDNNNIYPQINQVAPSTPPVYPSSVPGIVGVLSPYGITTNVIQCAVDLSLGSQSAFTQYGSSYEWNPVFDDGTTVTPIVYVTTTAAIPVNSTRVRLCMDFNTIHNNKHNALYGDGHVVAR